MNSLKKRLISLNRFLQKKNKTLVSLTYKKLKKIIPEKLTPLKAAGIASFSIFLFVTFLVLWALVIPLPSIDNFHNSQLPQSTKIYDSTGKVLLYDLHRSMHRTEVGLDQMSPFLKNATISIEDENFYKHFGFNPTSIVRAFLADVTSANLSQGGSTITQQVVKNNLLTGKKSISRKIKELILAVRLEHAYSKNEILQTYLNETPYGGT
ncbi:penicillin-binding protein, partial [Patescibacteria group bacterium]|nr:penicillin-binding protein [Patescibacteria group bacterium]